MRPPARPVELHPKFQSQLRGKSILTGLSEVRLVQICGELSEQGALNVLHGKAKQTPTNLQAVNAVAEFIGDCHRDEIVVGVLMPIVPTEIIVAILDDIIVEVKSVFAKDWLTHWRNSYDLTMKRGRQ